MGSKQIFCKRTDVPPVEIVKRSGDENDVPKTDEEVKPEPLVLLEPMEHVKVEFHADEYGYWEQSLASVQSAAVSAPMGGAKQDFITSVESTSWVQAFGTKADNCCGEESEYVNTEFSPGGDYLSNSILTENVRLCYVCNRVSTHCKCLDPLCLPCSHEEANNQVVRGSPWVAALTSDNHNNYTFKDSGESQISLLTEHILSPTGEHSFTCEQCSKSFGSKSILVKHRRLHTGEHSYKCELCCKSFSKKSHLAEHFRSHTGERPFTCDLCTKSFSTKGNLTKHSRLHTGERPYKCNLCSTSYSAKCELVIHNRTHTGERPFTCDLCSKSFSLKSKLVLHIRSHTGERPFTCELCSKSFSKKWNLILHVRSHTGEHPYKCKLCTKSYSARSNLIKHSRVHTGEHPYKCVLCSKLFSSTWERALHLRSHHNWRVPLHL